MTYGVSTGLSKGSIREVFLCQMVLDGVYVRTGTLLGFGVGFACGIAAVEGCGIRLRCVAAMCGCDVGLRYWHNDYRSMNR